MVALVQNIGTRFAHRARNWARRRQGVDGGAVTIASERIYILPTKTGFLYALIVFTMLLGSMNYSNNMGFALTFLLAGIGFVSMFHCHRNLQGLRITWRGAEPVFAGERLNFRYLVANTGNTPRWQICLQWDNGNAVYCELSGTDQTEVSLPLTTTARGLLEVPRLRVSTMFPLGLVRAWSWIHMDQVALVYPRPAKSAGPPVFREEGQQTSGRAALGDDDFSGLRSYRHGDPPTRIAWKAMARSGETLVTQYRGSDSNTVWIDWQSLPETDTEPRISALTRQVIDAHGARRSYGLNIPGTRIPPAHGARHRHRCLKKLALYGDA